ncbi:cobalamin 5'-phosphate synthase [Hyphomicrobium denitrificans 1NES1]|uniref:Adenosylcobinamide-GDP ribazoletransferase n=1 Tax=Hyphomicrobium denitrificans 1NES1 TaxID=670307 RepID=N0BEQ9_9HYPH|nr:adenosylcobinamide-GDP ribazoletransferase [Hyphomicrobium denitrificans]AGK58966.1 cobalamin 5'-phosphate synthase [Hyphomicrobium denitrificans 1NES1]
MIAREIRLFQIALQFLTQLPVGSIRDCPPDWLARSAKYMPLVGAIVGVIAGAGILLSAVFFPGPLPIVIGLVLAIAITGALHEDGLADTADAFGGGRTRERRLEIMKDSSIGTYGAIALIAAFALKDSALVALDLRSAACVMIAGHAGARLATILTMWRLPHAGGIAKVSQKISEMTPSEVAVAFALGLIPGLLVLPTSKFVVATLFAFAAAAIIALIARRKIAGYTGDVLGAVEQVFETVFFAVAAAVIAGPH